MQRREGWHVPDADQVALEIILSEVNDLESDILPRTDGRRTAIQAGGNLGIWPIALALHFERVITVEPDEENHAALMLNLDERLLGFNRERVRAYRGAFGARPGTAAIERFDPHNVGAHRIKGGAEFSVMRIDSLEVDDCDLLQLDVEGFEHFAVQGAERTIKTSWPTIVLELKGLGERYGVTDVDTITMLADWGYMIAGHVHRDVIFRRRP
jgi:FkbM family methyltransferase